MKPLVSIIIPTYQRCHSLKIALKSILSQTFHNYEVLIIDDGSTDGTKEMVNSFQDKRFFYFWQNNSGGPAYPRNKGIRHARGEWIAFLDSDDWWSPDKLKSCINLIDDKVDFIYHDLELISNKPKIFKRKFIKTRQLKKPVLTDLLLNGNIIGNSSVLVRRKLLILIGYIDKREELIASEDYHTWLKIAQLTNKFIYLPKKLGYYFQHDQNLSRKDMSIPFRNAVIEFKQFLSVKENLKLEAKIKYISGNYNFRKKNYIIAKKDLFFVLKKSDISFKIRSLILILLIFFKKFIK